MITTSQPYKPQFTAPPAAASPSLVARIAAGPMLWAGLSSTLMAAAGATFYLDRPMALFFALIGASVAASFVRRMVDPWPPGRSGGGRYGGWWFGDGDGDGGGDDGG